MNLYFSFAWGVQHLPRIAILPQTLSNTILSWASTHGYSQLKHQKLRVGGYMEKVLKCFNYPCAS